MNVSDTSLKVFFFLVREYLQKHSNAWGYFFKEMSQVKKDQKTEDIVQQGVTTLK